MKTQKSIRPIALLLALIITVSSLTLAADAAVASMNIKSSSSVSIAYGNASAVTYKGTYDNKTGFIQSLEFTPGSALVPTLVNGGNNISRYTLTTQLNQYNNSLKSGQVVGGINGGFFNTYGNAEGIQIQNGKLLSTNDYAKDNGSLGWKFYSVGFQADGGTVVDIPHFDITADSGSVSVSVNALNQLPSAAYGVWMLTAEYGSYAKWDLTYPQNNYYVLILKQTGGSLKVDGTLSASYVSYKRFTSGEASKCTLSDGYIYLVGCQANIQNIATAAQNDSVTISLHETTGKWKTVKNALRGGNLLVSKGKAVLSELDKSIMSSYTARTVLATKEDGSMGFFVIDNKSGKGSYLAGMPLVNTAQTLVNMGYTTAVNFDGGGSSAIAARKTESGSLTVMNTPSDGAQRAVANAIALVSYAQPDTLLHNFESGSFPVTKTGSVDADFKLWKNRKAEYSGISCGRLTYSFTASDGEIFLKTAAVTLPENSDSISVQANGLSSGINIRGVFENAAGNRIYSNAVRLSGDGYKQVYFSVPAAAVKFIGLSFVKGSGKKAGTVYLDNLLLHHTAYMNDAIAPTISVSTASGTKAAKGATLKMTATDNAWGDGVDKASCEIYINNVQKASGQSFTLTQTPSAEVNKVTYEAADNAGNRTRAFGVLTRSDYNAGGNFKDVKANGWATGYINYCYIRKILQGDNGYFRGSQNMTRAEFCATLVRLKKVNPSAYASVKLPYADAAKIPKWALNYVKAAYSLKIMTGSSSGGKIYFYPQSNITRAEVCTAIQSFLPNLAGFNAVAPFKDESTFPGWARANILRAAVYGIVQGDERGFRPNSAITRNEIAVILTRLY